MHNLQKMWVSGKKMKDSKEIKLIEEELKEYLYIG
jgi:hypothetical protein